MARREAMAVLVPPMPYTNTCRAATPFTRQIIEKAFRKAYNTQTAVYLTQDEDLPFFGIISTLPSSSPSSSSFSSGVRGNKVIKTVASC